MSPEQWRGEEAHPSWDLLALAVAAYEMLTGAGPFGGKSPVDSFGTGRVARFTPVAAHLREAPRSCQKLFERTFAHEPAQRPHSAGPFLSELQRALS